MTDADIDYTALLTRTQVAQRYPMLRKKLLEKLAYRGTGPHYITFAGKTWYRMEDVEAYLASATETPNLAARQKRHRVREILADGHTPPAREKAHLKNRRASQATVPGWGNKIPMSPFASKPARR